MNVEKATQEIITKLLLGQPKKVLDNYDLKYRVSKVDGVAQILTRDVKPQRINIEIENSIIVRVWLG